MKYKRKSSMMVRMAALLFVAMMFTMCFVGGTFAKYTSSAQGSDGAAVAKWSIKVGDTDIATANVFTFDLFNTIKDSNGTADEGDMAPVDGSIIAPGTSGKFDIVIKNDSEVNAKYSIAYTVTRNDNIPVQFSKDGTTWKTDINNLDVSDVTINMNETATVSVYWRWKYEDNRDADDTTLGTAASTPGIEVSAKVTATQVD